MQSDFNPPGNPGSEDRSIPGVAEISTDPANTRMRLAAVGALLGCLVLGLGAFRFLEGGGSAGSNAVTSVNPALPAVQSKEQLMRIEKATFGAGCFWGIEATFRQVKGVTSTAVGYAGGTLTNPTYEEVCNGDTGHAEVVQVEFDPEQVTYEELLNIFWDNHNPTTLNRQGPDIGTQYRSAVFYHNEAQQKAAEESKARLQSSGVFGRPIVTEITPASEFYRAEEYHQRYLEKHGRAHCRT